MATKDNVARAVDANLKTATRTGKARERLGDLALAIRYVARAQRLHIELASGVALLIPVSKIEGLAGAKAAVVREVRIVGRGYGLYWPGLDLDVSVPDLVAGSFGSKAWMSAMARTAGQVTSPAKAAAARRNGRLGGRPRKQPQTVNPPEAMT